MSDKMKDKIRWELLTGFHAMQGWLCRLAVIWNWRAARRIGIKMRAYWRPARMIGWIRAIKKGVRPSQPFSVTLSISGVDTKDDKLSDILACQRIVGNIYRLDPNKRAEWNRGVRKLEFTMNLNNHDLKITHALCVTFILASAVLVHSVIGMGLSLAMYGLCYIYVHQHRKTVVLKDLTNRHPDRLKQEWLGQVRNVCLDASIYIYLSLCLTRGENRHRRETEPAGQTDHWPELQWKHEIFRELNRLFCNNVSKTRSASYVIDGLRSLINRGWAPPHWFISFNTGMKKSKKITSPESNESKALLSAAIIDNFSAEKNSRGLLRYLSRWCAPVWMTYVAMLILLFTALLESDVEESRNGACVLNLQTMKDSCDGNECKYCVNVQIDHSLVMANTKADGAEMDLDKAEDGSIKGWMRSANELWSKTEMPYEKRIGFLALPILLWLWFSMLFVQHSIAQVDDLIVNNKMKDPNVAGSIPAALYSILQTQTSFHGIPGFQSHLFAALQGVAAMIYLVLVQSYISVQG